jgi:hypothetical protein
MAAATATTTTSTDKKRKEPPPSTTTMSTPPDGYACNLCKVPGHWIQQCSKKNKNKKKKSSSNPNHTPVAGVDPSVDDIDKARELQKITPPQCFCGIPSRLKKVKRSHVGGETSRAIGNYFFFCSRKKVEEPCRFARPVEDVTQPKKDRYCSFMLKKGTCKKGDKCAFSHDIPEELLPQNNGNSSNSRSKKKTATKKSKTEDEEDEPKTEPKTVEKESTQKEDDDDDKDGSSSSSDSDSEDDDQAAV